MWILPKNYHLSSHFARDMVESKEDLTCQGLNIESSLMWRSKPTQLQTWLRRWKPDSYLPHLFTRILKHSQRTCFEKKLTLSLVDIPVSHSVQQDSEKAQTTRDTCGHIYGDTLNQLDLLNASLKTSRVTSRLDSPQSLAIWKKMVISQRGEYSARKKLAHRTDESECISWATPNTSDSLTANMAPMQCGTPHDVKKRYLRAQVKMNPTTWATPNTMDHLPQRSEEALMRQATTTRKGRSKPANLREQVNPTAVQIYQKFTSWPTPSARDYKGANGYETTLAKLADGKRAQMGQLPNAVMIANKGSGHLNPDWVEWLMGVPTGWTALDY
jgi:hypothetical protein